MPLPLSPTVTTGVALTTSPGAGEPRPGTNFLTMQRFYWALVVLSLAAFSMAVTPPADTWWYLAGGREILLQKQMSFPDPFSFTTAGQSWFRQAWLVEIIFYILWVMGGLPGIFALRTLFIVLAFGLVPMVLVKERDDPLPYLCFPLLIWLGQAEMFVDVRAYLFTYLFLSLTLLWARWFMENGQLKWALLGIAVMPIWANCHGGFILGSGVWGIIGLGLLLAKDRRGVKLIGVSLTGYFLAVFEPIRSQNVVVPVQPDGRQHFFPRA